MEDEQEKNISERIIAEDLDDDEVSLDEIPI
jgi:hypothetical protein